MGGCRTEDAVFALRLVGGVRVHPINRVGGDN